MDEAPWGEDTVDLGGGAPAPAEVAPADPSPPAARGGQRPRVRVRLGRLSQLVLAVAVGAVLGAVVFGGSGSQDRTERPRVRVRPEATRPAPERGAAGAGETAAPEQRSAARGGGGRRRARKAMKRDSRNRGRTGKAAEAAEADAPAAQPAAVVPSYESEPAAGAEAVPAPEVTHERTGSTPPAVEFGM